MELTRTIRHIAFTLLVIFVFPIFFQSIHIVWHGSHQTKCCDHHSTCQLNEIQTHSGSQLEETEGHCPICEYEFSINDLPSHSVVEFCTRKIQYKFIETQVSEFVAPFVLQKIPRAPPA